MLNRRSPFPKASPTFVAWCNKAGLRLSNFVVYNGTSFPDRDPIHIGRRKDKDGSIREIYHQGSKPAKGYQICPFDRQAFDATEPDAPYLGCFYRCRLFKPDGQVPRKDEALRLYDARIKEFVNKLKLR